MKRSLVLLAVAAATCASMAGLSVQASAEPDRPTSHPQSVHSPDGRLATTVPGRSLPGRPLPGRPDPSRDTPPATSLAGAAGSGCPARSSSQYFCHAGGYQYVTADGAYMSTTVESPAVESGDYHSLAELAVESSDGQQIIEIGWTVDPTQFDQTPRLFIFHWVNGQGTCYNTCDFTSNSTTVTPGMALTPSSTPAQFGIEYYQGNWWYSYNGTWFGYLPGSVWGGGYVQSGLVQEFGEVASSTAQPCTDMGNGAFGSDPAAAAVTGVSYYNASTAVSLTSTMDDPTLYSSQVTSSNSFGYGGAGAC